MKLEKQKSSGMCIKLLAVSERSGTELPKLCQSNSQLCILNSVGRNTQSLEFEFQAIELCNFPFTRFYLISHTLLHEKISQLSFLLPSAMLQFFGPQIISRSLCSIHTPTTTHNTSFVCLYTMFA